MCAIVNYIYDYVIIVGTFTMSCYGYEMTVVIEHDYIYWFYTELYKVCKSEKKTRGLILVSPISGSSFFIILIEVGLERDRWFVWKMTWSRRADPT